MLKKLIGILIIGIISIPMYFISNINSDNSDEYVKPNIESTISVDNKEENNSENTFSYSPIPDHIRNKMLGKSMPTNEPIDFDNLSYLRLTYYDFNGNTNVGEMIVDKRVAAEVVDIFKELYDKKYPIEKIRLIDEYDAIDNASMVDNNSSAFCYRTIAGTDKISNHSLGLAIDINPLQNPHVIGNSTNPKEAFAFSDRSLNDKGMIKEGDDCYNAFVKRGWSWGGHWSNPDYQHFEKQL